MPIEQVGKKIGEGEVKLPLDNPAIVSALQKGNVQDVYKILSEYGLTIGDYKEFLEQRHVEWLSMLQEDPFTSQEGQVAPPDFEQDFLPQDPANYMSDSDAEYAGQSLMKAMSPPPKAAVGGKASGKAGGVPDTAGINADIEEWNQFNEGVLGPKIFEMQFMQQLQSKSAELENELQKVLAMAKSGEADPTVVIVALAKVTAEKNGLIYSHLGEKVLKRNAEINTINESLRGGNVDPATLTAASTDMRNVSQNLQFIIGDMQKVVQNTESALQTAKSMLDLTNQSRLEIIRRLSGQ